MALAVLSLSAQGLPGVESLGYSLLDGESPLLSSDLLSSAQPDMKIGRKAVVSAPARAGLEGEPIYDEPEGEKVDYLRESIGFYVLGGAWQFGKTLNFSSIIYSNDGKAYIYNPFGGWITNSYLECSIEEDRLVAKLPQPIYQQPSAITGEPTDFFITLLYKMETENKVSYEMPDEDEEQSVSFIIEDGKVYLDIDYDPVINEAGRYEYPEIMLGMVESEGNWVTVGDCKQTYELNTLTLVEAPEDLELQDWLISSGGVATQIGIGFYGDEVYMNNLSPYLPDSFIKGKMVGDKIVFEAGQYVGTYTTNLIYFIGGSYEADGSYQLLDKLEFDYDRENNTITIDEGHFIAYSASIETLIYLSIYLDPSFKIVNPNPNPTPLAPVPVQYADYYENYGYSILYIDLPNMNIDNDLLDTSNMYYKVYMDGEPFVFYAEEYGFEEDMTDIPYNFSNNGGIIMVSSTGRYLYFFLTGYETIGLQMFNVKDGEVYSSEITTYNVIDDTVTGVKDVAFDNEYVEEYYSVSGVRNTNLVKGINIVKKIFKDGRVKIEKLYVK